MIWQRQPEMGLPWAAAMAGAMITLGATAITTVFARDALLRVLSSHGTRVQLINRLIKGFAGVLLIILALRELPL